MVEGHYMENAGLVYVSHSSLKSGIFIGFIAIYSI